MRTTAITRLPAAFADGNAVTTDRVLDPAAALDCRSAIPPAGTVVVVVVGAGAAVVVVVLVGAADDDPTNVATIADQFVWALRPNVAMHDPGAAALPRPVAARAPPVSCRCST